MASYEAETRQEGKTVVERAVAYFGEGGLGLKISERSDCCVFFEGGGGHVNLLTTPQEKKTRVNIETREWDYQVKNFLRILK
jgi:hypothetical protein